MTPRRAWSAFWLLGVIWGSSFLFIRIAVEQLSTFQVVFLRTAIAAVGLHAVRRFQGSPLPRDRQGIRDLVFLGVVNTALPFALITWGEKSVDSGLAAVLQATAALFTAMLAHVTFADERLTRRSVVALLIAFAGVAVLGSRGLHAQSTTSGAVQQVLGILAIVGASCCYAVGGTYSRSVMKRQVAPIVVASGSMIVTAVLTGLVVLAQAASGDADLPAIHDLRTRVVVAIVLLGVVNTFAAYLLFYSVLRVIGSARASTVTYVIPPVGLVLGALVLDEPVDRWLAIGSGMILVGLTLMRVSPRNLLRQLISMTGSASRH